MPKATDIEKRKYFTTKDGRVYCRIQVSRGKGLSPYSCRWYVPEDLLKKQASKIESVRLKAGREIENQLAIATKDFKAAVLEGKVMSREERRQTEEAARLDEEIRKAKNKSFKAFCEENYMPMKKSVSGISLRTVDHYEYTLKHVYKYPLAEYPINEITPVMISTLYLDELNAGATVGTLKRIDVTLRQVFDLAYKSDICPISPMLKVDKPKEPKVEKNLRKKIKSLSVEELNKVLEYAKNDYINAQDNVKASCFKWYVFITLLAFSGCRCGELCGLSWKNCDFENNQITIDKHVIFSNSRGLMIEESTKTAKDRVIPIDAEVMKLLHEYKRFQMLAGDNTIKLSKYVFVQNDGITPMSPQTPVQYLSKFSRRHGLEALHLHPHLFRHTFASLSVQGNADIASLSANLGHAQISTTLDMYVHASLEGQKRAASIFSNVVKSGMN